MSPVKNQIISWGDKDHIAVVVQLNMQVTPAKRKKIDKCYSSIPYHLSKKQYLGWKEIYT